MNDTKLHFDMKKEKYTFIEEFDPVRKRRMATKYRSLSGVIPTTKNEELIWFESSLERDFALILEYKPDVYFYQDQPLTIEYFYNGKTRRYTPDFFVQFRDEECKKPWLCEIKYKQELQDKFSEYKPRFKAAKAYCEEEGWEFKLFTEEFIRTPLLDNINFLSRYQDNDVDQACYRLVFHTISDLGITTPEEFMLAIEGMEFNMKGRCLYALWYAIKKEHISCDIVTEKISMNSEIWLTEKFTFNFKTD